MNLSGRDDDFRREALARLGITTDVRDPNAEGPSVDVAWLKALARGELEGDEKRDVCRLIGRFESWATAFGEIFRSGATQPRETDSETRLSDAETVAEPDSAEVIIESLRHDRSHKATRRTFVVRSTLTAGLVLIACGLLYWYLQPPKPVLVAQLEDVPGSLTLDSAGTLRGIQRYPEFAHERIQAMIQEESISYNEDALEFVRTKGAGDRHKVCRAPVNTVVKGRRPTFRWHPVEGATEYQVEYGSELAEKKLSEPVQDLEWIPEMPLQLGAVYHWKVVWREADRNEYTADEPEAVFRVIGQRDFEEMMRQLELAGQSHLARIAVFQRFALLDDVRCELDALAKLNPNSELVQQLLESVDSDEPTNE